MTDITKLREYLEERKRQLETVRHDAITALMEINDTLAQIGNSDTPSAEPESPKPPSSKPTREACADAIMEHYAGKEIPLNEHTLYAEVFNQWQPKTIRAALRIARTRREGAAVLQMPKAAET
jgi:hypothetical protein